MSQFRVSARIFPSIADENDTFLVGIADSSGAHLSMKAKAKDLNESSDKSVQSIGAKRLKNGARRSGTSINIPIMAAWQAEFS